MMLPFAFSASICIAVPRSFASRDFNRSMVRSVVSPIRLPRFADLPFTPLPAGEPKSNLIKHADDH